MISDEEVPYIKERGKYYSISSMLPEVSGQSNINFDSPLTKEYSSEDSVIGLGKTIDLLTKYDLMPSHSQTNGEFLR